MAFYPILNTTLHGENIHQWVDREMEAIQTRIDQKQSRLEQVKIEAGIMADDDSMTDDALPKSVVAAKAELGSEIASLERYQWIRPKIEAWVPKSPFQTVACIVGILMVSTVIKHLFLVINELLVGRAAIDISRTIRMKVFDKAMTLDRRTFSVYGTSGFSAHITHTAEGLSQGLMNTLGGAIREPLKIFTCLLGAAYICPRLLMLSLLVAPVVGYMLYWLTRRLKTISQRVLMKAGSFHQVMLESLGNIQTVQAYAMEGHESGRFRDATLDMRNFGLKFIFYTALTKPVIELLGVGMLCTTIVGGAYLVLNQETRLLGMTIRSQPLTVAELLTFFGCLVGASDPLRKLSAVYSSIYAGAVAADALYPLLDTPSQISEPTNPLSVAQPHQNIQLRNICFEYLPNHPVLENVSLDIPFGSTVAIVGHNGSGKSTLINLLCRFYDPAGGSISIDGVNLRDLALDDLRKRIALVTQTTEMFNDTVRYNIRYGTPDATDAEVEAAAREAHAHEFISTVLSNGYDSMVGQNGQSLSGGQRQRISLARALLCDPEILILDEATSQIDMHSEALIRDSLSKHRGKRTLIFITHREALLDLADVVYTVHDRGMHLTERKATKAA